MKTEKSMLPDSAIEATCSPLGLGTGASFFSHVPSSSKKQCWYSRVLASVSFNENMGTMIGKDGMGGVVHLHSIVV